MQAPSARNRYSVFCLVLFLSGIVPLGCGESLPPLAPVKGTVYAADGSKLTSGQVSLVPETADTTRKVPPSSGKIESDGTYEIFTGGKPGAPLVKYKITISPDMSKGGMAQGKAPYDQKYREANKTPLKYEVVASPEANRYDLKLK
jgi:hypothetical protein